MATASAAMASVGQAANPAKMQQTMQQFAKENAKMDMASEMMGDAVDDALDDDEVEDETDDLMNQVCGQIMQNLTAVTAQIFSIGSRPIATGCCHYCMYIGEYVAFIVYGLILAYRFWMKLELTYTHRWQQHPKTSLRGHNKKQPQHRKTKKLMTS